MRKLFLLSFAMFTLNAAFTQSNIPNGDLEEWYQITLGSVSYEQPGTAGYNNFLGTLNDLVAVLPPIGPGPQTVFKTDDKYSGTYAAKLVSANFPLSDCVNVFIPGMLGTAQMDYAAIAARIGKECPGCRPVKISGYFKAMPVNGDSCAVVILASKWNSETKKKDTIGYNRFVIYDQVTTYTRFDLPVNYNPDMNSVVPDSLTILAVSSAGFNAVQFMQQVGQEGSTMYVDELMLEYPLGLGEALMPDVGVNCYPNPARQTMIVELSEVVKDAFFEVYDLNGKLCGSFAISSVKNIIPVAGLADGTYYFRLKEGKNILNTGSFIVQH